MSEEPVIGVEETGENASTPGAEPVIGGPAAGNAAEDAHEGEMAERLRDALLAAHRDLAPEDLAGEHSEDVRKAFVAARARIERETAEARAAQVPAGAPGRFTPEPGSAFEKIREGLTRLNA